MQISTYNERDSLTSKHKITLSWINTPLKSINQEKMQFDAISHFSTFKKTISKENCIVKSW